jgi:hypothetical protein
MKQESSTMKITIPENLEFSELHLVRGASTAGAIEFDWEPIEAICDASGIDISVFYEDQAKLSSLLMAWYAKHRELGGAQDPVMEELIEEARIEDELGLGISHKPGNA